MKIKLFILLVLFSFRLKAQQETVHSLGYMNPLLYNSAVTGTMDQDQLFILNRIQWKDFGGPQTKAGTFDFRVPGQSFSTGLIFLNQAAGAFNQTKVKLNYTHHIQVSKTARLLLGISPGIAMNSFNTNAIRAVRSDDPVLTGTEKSTKPDIDAGILYKNKNLQAGVSILQLEGDMFSGLSVPVVPNRQIVLNAKYDITAGSEGTFIFTPIICVRSSGGNPLFIDGSVTAFWNKMLWLATGYKAGYAASVSAGVQVKGIRIGYAYEVPVNSIKGFIPPSHEFGLGYVFRSSSQSEQKKKTTVKTDRNTGKVSAAKKKELLELKLKELQQLEAELSDREDNLAEHERKIYALIDSLYTRAGQEKTKTNEEELERVARTQREVNKIKQELKVYTREKNTELFRLKQQIEALRREIDTLR